MSRSTWCHGPARHLGCPAGPCGRPSLGDVRRSRPGRPSRHPPKGRWARHHPGGHRWWAISVSPPSRDLRRQA